MEKRDFKGIWIPKEVWLSKDLTLQEKIFLVEISSLDNEEGCFASNGYFADFFGISKTRVSLIIKSLTDKGYIISKIIYKKGTKEILKRVLKESYRPPLTFVKYPTQQKLKDNNTINNTINNTVNNKGEVKKKAKSIEERKSNFRETLLPFLETYGKEVIDEFFDYWTEPLKNNKGLRFEGEKAFGISRRIRVWVNNNKKWGKETPKSPYSLKQTPIER